MRNNITYMPATRAEITTNDGMVEETKRRNAAGQAAKEQRLLTVGPALSSAANLTKQKPTWNNYDDRLDAIVFFFIDRFRPENIIQ